ncbi:hypothetical protein QFZ57_004326, partial [Arthrobacter sp. B1I2]|nr:hypothetical protein [Arthrobacter sp. B1I2]
RRSTRWNARRFLGYESSLRRVRYCGRDSVSGSVAFKASGTGENRRAGVSQVKRCGSTWACPVCSHKIASSRAAEIADAVQAWHKRGNRIIFLTLTMRHKKHHALDDLWENGVSAGWNKVTSGRAWKDDQAAYGTTVSRLVKTGKRAGETVTEKRIGFARVVEVTHGKNGWHVHIHALLFVRGDIVGSEALALGDRIFGRWLPALTDAGFGSPSLRHGVDVRLLGPGDQDRISEYFAKSVYGNANAAKVGWEAAGSVNKIASKKFGNRTPFQILSDLVESGDADDLDLWWAWEKASHGKRQLTWSPWLRAELALGAEESDQELADKELDGEVVLTLRQDQYDAIFPVVPELLDLIEEDATLLLAWNWLDQKLGQWKTCTPLYSGPPLAV